MQTHRKPGIDVGSGLYVLGYVALVVLLLLILSPLADVLASALSAR